jgi:hypothetical protein
VPTTQNDDEDGWGHGAIAPLPTLFAGSLKCKSNLPASATFRCRSVCHVPKTSVFPRIDNAADRSTMLPRKPALKLPPLPIARSERPASRSVPSTPEGGAGQDKCIFIDCT